MLAFLLVHKIVNEATISITGLYSTKSHQRRCGWCFYDIEARDSSLPQYWLIFVFTQNKIRYNYLSRNLLVCSPHQILFG
jgi:hypothetical protein